METWFSFPLKKRLPVLVIGLSSKDDGKCSLILIFGEYVSKFDCLSDLRLLLTSLITEDNLYVVVH